MIGELEKTLQNFDPISLKQLSDYKLLNRIDTKYICNINSLPLILNNSHKDFRIQQINNDRIFNYESLYFDTPDLKTFFDHHQGKRLRYKIRFRKYVDTGNAFLEIKKKKNYIRTDKKRTELEFAPIISDEHLDFLKEHIQVPEAGFHPSIWTIFNRITLAGRDHLERITIDTNISFKDENSKTINLPNMAIVEVKRNRTGDISPFTQILKDLRIRPFGISKYVLGNVLLSPDIKHNRFHKKVVTVNKICNGTKFNY
ncbi:MAG: polyphosphate polymerase domain-containing protein [Bacteroidales bacterium]|nr:polyphosphate polymerase domain-containing protein [Bacteroidales bacterium]